jgi:hypothetical protein
MVEDNTLQCNCGFVSNIIDCACGCGQRLTERNHDILGDLLEDIIHMANPIHAIKVVRLRHGDMSKLCVLATHVRTVVAMYMNIF